MAATKANITYHALDSYASTTTASSTPSESCSKIVILSNESLVESSFSDPKVTDGTDNAALYMTAARSLSQAKESSKSVTFLVTSNPSLLQHVTIAILPKAASRHNTRSRSHEVTKVVQSHKDHETKGKLEVVIITDDSDFVFAQSISVARAFPLYSSKTSGDRSRDSNPEREVNVVIKCSNISDWSDRLREITEVAGSIRLCAELVDTPPNELNCRTYVERVRKVQAEVQAEVGSCKLHVIQGTDLRDQGFGGIWGVGKASDNLPALAILSHVPAECTEDKSICLVGKGIVYDTGGLSIKISGNMCGMKGDMGGSAAVLGAFKAIAKCNLKAPVHALLCIAENSVGPIATRPDDIHTMFSGKTVEINNTDAEGRLVLGDGVAYASAQLNPKVIIDIATLTGAQLISTGRRHAAIVSNSDSLDLLAQQIGRYSGDLVHPILYCPEFFKSEFASKVADMKNSVKDRSNAQSSCAGQFICNHIDGFIDKGGEWLHVDMAGPATSSERGTGYGVALLYSIVKNLSMT